MVMARISKDLKNLITSIQIEFLKENKKPPSIKSITQVIAKRAKKQEILYDEFIRFR